MSIAALDVLLHPSLRSGAPESLRLARLTAAISVVLLSTVSLIMPLVAVTGDATGALHIGFSFACYCVALGLLRFRGDRVVAAHVVTSGLLFALADGLRRADGTHSSALSWLALVPMMVVMFLGVRAATLWTIASCAIVVALAIRELMGITVPLTPDLGDTSTIVRAVVQILQVAVYFAIARSFDAAKRRMAEELEIERRVAEEAHRQASVAHRAARRVLDAVDQALFTIAPDGRVSDEVSSAATRWFGAPPANVTAWEWLGKTDAHAAQWLEIGWAQHCDGTLPEELTLAQLPARMRNGGRSYGIRWLATDRPGEVLAVVSDTTDALAAEQEQRAQREIVALLARCVRDPEGVATFVDEASRIVSDVESGRLAREPAALARALHTLKGNAGVFELHSLAALCHGIEDRVAETGVVPDADRAALGSAWRALQARLGPFVEKDARSMVRVPREQVAALASAVAHRTAHADIERTVRSWLMEPTRTRLDRAADQARALAVRLERAPLEVTVEDHGIGASPEEWAPFWAAFTHAIRNAIDHGVETAEQRSTRGKSGPARLWLGTRVEGSEIVVSVRDDGPGIDWTAVARRAHERGFLHATYEELTEALFADGVSTASAVTEVSGRGVGMSALREATRHLGGRVVVSSHPDRGTTLELRVPVARGAFRVAA